MIPAPILVPWITAVAEADLSNSLCATDAPTEVWRSPSDSDGFAAWWFLFLPGGQTCILGSFK